MGNMTIKQEFSIGDRVIIKGGNQLFGKILKINKKTANVQRDTDSEYGYIIVPVKLLEIVQ